MLSELDLTTKAQVKRRWHKHDHTKGQICNSYNRLHYITNAALLDDKIWSSNCTVIQIGGFWCLQRARLDGEHRILGEAEVWNRGRQLAVLSLQLEMPLHGAEEDWTCAAIEQGNKRPPRRLNFDQLPKFPRFWYNHRITLNVVAPFPLILCYDKFLLEKKVQCFPHSSSHSN